MDELCAREGKREGNHRPPTKARNVDFGPISLALHAEFS